MNNADAESLGNDELVNANAAGGNEPQLQEAPTDRITLIVDNTRFTIEKALLTAHPRTMLGAMFTTGLPLVQRNEYGDYEIATDTSHTVFEALLGYYQRGVINCPFNVPIKEMKQGCDYFHIPFDMVRTYNLQVFLNVISDEGARKQFLNFLVDLILPAALISAQRGARECQVIVLLEDEKVDWNAEHAPKTDKEFIEIIHSDAMHRFFKYVENRDVAKQLLTERGLRKVRCGFEWCPTRKQKKRGLFASVSYGDVQRPFIYMSWEQEQARNRHVGFQLITSNMQQVNPFAPLELDDADDPINDEDGNINAAVRLPFAANGAVGGAAAVVVDEAAGGIVLLSDLQRAARGVMDEQG